MLSHTPDLSHATWRKSSRSSSQGQNCVEITASKPGIIAVRDSKNPGGPKLSFTSRDWGSFIQAVKDTEIRNG